MILVAVAAFLPWVSILGFGIVGIRGDGQITLACATVGLVVLLLQVRRAGGAQSRPLRIVAYVAAGLATLIGLIDMNGAAAIGLYMTLFGAIGWLGALIWDTAERRREAGIAPQIG